jgi:hypothetical protein
MPGGDLRFTISQTSIFSLDLMTLKRHNPGVGRPDRAEYF